MEKKKVIHKKPLYNRGYSDIVDNNVEKWIKVGNRGCKVGNHGIL